MMRNICFFMGSKAPDQAHVDAVVRLAHQLASRGCNLVWGGQASGLMKVIGDVFASYEGCELIGITTPEIRAFCADMHPACTRVIVAENEADRDAKYREYADCFVAAPGGFGTKKEAGNQVEQNYLDIHRLRENDFYQVKPVFYLNVGGYWNDEIRQCQRIMGFGDWKCAYSSPQTAHVFWPNQPTAIEPDDISEYIKRWDAMRIWQAIRKNIAKEKTLAAVA